MLSTSKRNLVSFVVATAIVAPSFALLTPTLAVAQPAKAKKPLRDQLPEEAKKHWDTAVESYQRKQWDVARTSFNAAFEASKYPRVLFNVAVCEKNLARYGRAIEVFKRELVEGKGVLSAEEEAEIRTQITGLERFDTQITIDVSEPGAEVDIDEAKVVVSPLATSISAPVGERHIRVSKVGFADARETIELKAETASRVSLKLTPIQKTALVNIEVVGPKTAIVKVDGREVGTAP